MNLEFLYKKQQEVDNKIAEKGVKLDHYLNLEHRIFAFQCELMELANEIGFFKDWKHSHEINHDAAIKELADCLAFVFSIGITKGYDKLVKEIEGYEDLIEFPYLDLFNNLRNNDLNTIGSYKMALIMLIAIGRKLGFSSTGIIFNYIAKSNINIQRQEEGY